MKDLIANLDTMPPKTLAETGLGKDKQGLNLLIS